MNSKVYIIREITNNSLIEIFNFITNGKTFGSGKTGIKIHSGELGGSNFIQPNLIRNIIRKTNGTIVDANTPYPGNRNNNLGHWKTFKEHGFMDIANCDLLDEEGDVELPVIGGKYLSKNYVGSHFFNYDSFIILTHFKGHSTCGYGGALKDYSIGLASLKGKCWIHTAGQSINDVYFPTVQEQFLDSMVDAMSSIKNLNKEFLFINIMNNLSIDGDGNPNPKKPAIDDIGILASTDPVALDKACVDLIYGLDDERKKEMIDRIEEKKGRYVIEEAGKRKIGNVNYKLVYIK